MITYKKIQIPETIDEWELYRTSAMGVSRALTNTIKECIDLVSWRAHDTEIEEKCLRKFSKICVAYSDSGANDSEPVQIGCEVLAKTFKYFLDENITAMELYYRIRNV